MRIEHKLNCYGLSAAYTCEMGRQKKIRRIMSIKFLYFSDDDIQHTLKIKWVEIFKAEADIFRFFMQVGSYFNEKKTCNFLCAWFY